GVRGGFEQDQSQAQGRRGGRRGNAQQQNRSGGVNGGGRGGSMDIAVGDGLTTQYEKAVVRLQNMQADITTDRRGNRQNTYSKQDIIDQKDRVSKLQNDIDKTKQDIAKFQAMIDHANNETLLTG